MKVYFEPRLYQEEGQIVTPENTLGVTFVNFSDANCFINGLPITPKGSWSAETNRGEFDTTDYKLSFSSSVTSKSVYVILKLPR